MSCLCPKVSKKFIYAIIYKFEKFRGWQLLSFLLKLEFLKLLILPKTVPRQRSSKLFGDNKLVALQNLIKDASSQWSFGPNSACGSKETATIE